MTCSDTGTLTSTNIIKKYGVKTKSECQEHHILKTNLVIPYPNMKP